MKQVVLITWASSGIGKATDDSYAKPGGFSPASVVSETIVKAVAAKKTETRCRVGHMAKPMVWMRVFLGDRIFDRVLENYVKQG